MRYAFALCLTSLALTACSASTSSSRKQPLGPGAQPALYGTTRVVEAPSARSTLAASGSTSSASRAPAPANRAAVTGSSGTLAVGLDTNNQVVTSGDFRGKVVVLDFWATWCGPCKASSPAFQQLSDRFSGDSRVMTLAVHTDQTGDPKAYMREHQYTFPMIPRGQEFAAAYDVSVLPTFIVLDQRGRIIYRDTGMMGESQRAEVERLVSSTLR